MGCIGVDDIEKELKAYQESLAEEKRKTARINIILLVVLIIVIMAFLYALWRYQAIH
ncbi:MAG: hypothetical protein KO316_02405 [Methanobacterium sp.]|nr:hypothetical protein [Methanobacterium sp.]